MRFVYLHGFASGPSSRKARAFAEAFAGCGCQVEVPDLAAGDFAHLTITGQLEVLEALLGGQPCRLVGSSMGGYLAALYAAGHPEVERLVLLAPAFGLSARWPLFLGPRAFAEWREKGLIDVQHYGMGVKTPIHFDLVVDSLKHPPYPVVRQPTLIFHGTHDDVVPVQNSRSVAAGNAAARLVELDSDHELLGPLGAIVRESRDFLLAP